MRRLAVIAVAILAGCGSSVPTTKTEQANAGYPDHGPCTVERRGSELALVVVRDEAGAACADYATALSKQSGQLWSPALHKPTGALQCSVTQGANALKVYDAPNRAADGNQMCAYLVGRGWRERR